MLVWFLRGTAVTLLSAALAVVVPHSWMDAVHCWLGMGDLPDEPLVGYLTRSLSALYAAIGACYWFLSNDVRHYLRLLRFSIPVTAVFAAALIGIDCASAMPAAWTIVEAIFLVSWCAANAWLTFRLPADRR